MKLYVGTRQGGRIVTVQEPGVKDRPLAVRHDLRNHSPDGFEWGYGGSGPAQLALALLADVVVGERALRSYQDFKFMVVGKLPPTWRLTEDQIRATVEGIEKARGR
jgi:hypothetical protein